MANKLTAPVYLVKCVNPETQEEVVGLGCLMDRYGDRPSYNVIVPMNMLPPLLRERIQNNPDFSPSPYLHFMVEVKDAQADVLLHDDESLPIHARIMRGQFRVEIDEIDLWRARAEQKEYERHTEALANIADKWQDKMRAFYKANGVIPPR